jgi:hypothetical protein
MALIAASGILLACSCSFFTDPFGSSPFDSEAWKAYPASADNKRYEMLNDLENSFLWANQSVQEIEDALGRPDSQSQSGTALQYVYVCGTPPGAFRIDPEVLVLGFIDGRLASWRHYES